MKDIAILMACWKSPELLKVSIPSLIKSIKTNSEIIVILNEVDNESLDYLNSLNIKTINLKENYGPSAVDFAIPYIIDKFKYVANINSDMIFSNGWDIEVIKLLNEHNPCTISCCLVEPIINGHSIYENLGDFTKPNNHEIFNEYVKNGKYKTNLSVSYNHPIICTMDDFISVNGYSNQMKNEWVELKGRGLDDDFVYRLYKKHNGNIKYLKSDKAFVYHGISLNSKKLTNRQSGRDTFKKLNGITIDEFRKLISYNV